MIEQVEYIPAEGYWLASGRHNGILALAEGDTETEARRAWIECAGEMAARRQISKHLSEALA